MVDSRRQRGHSNRAHSIVLDAKQAPRSIAADVTKAVSSRKPWSTPVNAMRCASCIAAACSNTLPTARQHTKSIRVPQARALRALSGQYGECHWSGGCGAFDVRLGVCSALCELVRAGCGRQATKQQAYKFWEEQDQKIFRDNKLAAWGATPSWHPKNRNVVPRTKLQKW